MGLPAVLTAALLTSFFAASAQAQVLSMSFDKASYAVGETMTLTVTGDAQGAADNLIVGSVVYDPAVVTPLGGQTQSTLTSSGIPWITVPLGVGSVPGTQDSFGQFKSGLPSQVDLPLTAVMRFRADAEGPAVFDWHVGTLDFFGPVDAICASVEITEDLPSVPGFDVFVYALVTDPTRLAFAPDGTLYTGRDELGSGGAAGDSTFIHEIGPGGSPVVEYGNSAIPDPDAVVVDVDGDIGSAGSVLVGGFVNGATGGRISEVALDESVTTRFTTTALENPTGMAFDSTGRLLVVNFGTGTGLPGVYFWSTGDVVPTTLFTTTFNLEYMALGDNDDIFVSAVDGTIQHYSPTGTLLGVVPGLGGSAPIAFGEEITGSGVPGLYAVNSAGELLFFDFGGLPAVVGTGFELVNDLEFGPDGALYAAEFDLDRILRLPEPVGGLPAGLLLLAALKRRRPPRESLGA